MPGTHWYDFARCHSNVAQGTVTSKDTTNSLVTKTSVKSFYFLNLSRIPLVYGNRRFITVFTKGCLWTPP